jgi:hypothetical protein
MTTALRDASYVPGGNLALRRGVFELVGGFDESIETGEDPDLCRRVAVEGLRVVEASSMRSVHLGEPTSLRAVFRRHRWHGRGLRLHYADGHLVPVAIATAAFALTLLAVPTGVVLAALTREPSWLTMALTPLMVPFVYSCRHGKNMGHTVLLWPIYQAYFIGRAVGLPAAIRTGFARARLPKRAPS